jgi:hypothetical protein
MSTVAGIKNRSVFVGEMAVVAKFHEDKLAKLIIKNDAFWQLILVSFN